MSEFSFSVFCPNANNMNFKCSTLSVAQPAQTGMAWTSEVLRSYQQRRLHVVVFAKGSGPENDW